MYFIYNQVYRKFYEFVKVESLLICSGKERIKTENGEKLHSTQKPVELLRRVILVFAKEGDFVLDLIAGTGTTGYVAKILDRNFVLIEQELNYVKGIIERLMSLDIEKS